MMGKYPRQGSDPGQGKGLGQGNAATNELTVWKCVGRGNRSTGTGGTEWELEGV